MEYVDEKILSMKNHLKKYKNKNINETVYVGEEEFEFEYIELFDERMKVKVPKSFTDMPLELARIKYPSEQRPQIIKTNSLGSVNFTFTLMEYNVEEEDIEELKNQFKAAIQRMNPSILFYSHGVESVNDNKVGYFDYKSFALDDTLYNMMYFTIIDSKLMMGSFNSAIHEMEEWKLILPQVINSIIDLTVEEGAVK